MIFDSSSTIFPQFFPGGPAASPEATWHMAGTRQTVSWQPKLGNFYGDLRCRNGDFGDLWTLKNRLKRRNYKK